MAAHARARTPWPRIAAAISRILLVHRATGGSAAHGSLPAEPESEPIERRPGSGTMVSSSTHGTLVRMPASGSSCDELPRTIRPSIWRLSMPSINWR